MKLGIGITTYKRPEHLKKCLEQIAKHTTIAHKLFINDDSLTKQGVAASKNNCLKALKDCDYIFLFDDDCFPIKDNWEKYFIDMAKSSGQQHFCYLRETQSIKSIGGKEIKSYNNCAGAMMFFTKTCIEKAGLYTEAFGRYGFEHAELSERINKLELTSSKYICPELASEFIYSMDLDSGMEGLPKHKPSMTNEEVMTALIHSRKVYTSQR